MTHSLHRRGDYKSLRDDFVVLGCPATGVNKAGSAPKTRKFLSVCYKHGPINLGDIVEETDSLVRARLNTRLTRSAGVFVDYR